MRRIMVIGHRGAMAHEPENSLSSFETAIALGADMVELDVRTTKDGEIVALHDEDIARCTNGTGKVSKMSLAEIRAFRLKNHERVPTLRETLEKMNGRCQVNVHIKDAGAVLRSCGIVKEMKMMGDVIFTAFHGSWLIEIKSKCPHARVACIAREKDANIVRAALSLGAEAIHPKSRITTKKMIDEAHKAGLKVNVWTVNFSWQMKKFIGWGADGIITDKPDLMIRTLGKLGLR